jgi:hypothetical protein
MVWWPQKAYFQGVVLRENPAVYLNNGALERVHTGWSDGCRIELLASHA